MTALLQKMALFLALMVLGYVLTRKRVVSREFSRDASKLTMNVFTTGAIFSAVFSNAGGIGTMQILQCVGVMTAATAVGYVLGWILSRVSDPPRDKRGQIFLLTAVSNNMFIGLPVAQLLYGPTAVLYMTLCNLPFNAFIFSWGMVELCSDGIREKLRVKDVVSLPLVATVLAGICCILNVRPPKMVCDLAATLGNAMLPMSMLVIGASMGDVDLLDCFRRWRYYLIALVRLLVTPVLVWLLLHPFVADPILFGTAVIMAACPTGVMVTILSIQKGKDPAFSSQSILLTTLLSMGTIPLIIAVLGLR